MICLVSSRRGKACIAEGRLCWPSARDVHLYVTLGARACAWCVLLIPTRVVVFHFVMEKARAVFWDVHQNLCGLLLYTTHRLVRAWRVFSFV